MSKTIARIFVNYRIKANAAWSEVEDGVYTQKEYIRAIDKLNDQAEADIQALIDEEKTKAIGEGLLLARYTVGKDTREEKAIDRLIKENTL